MLYNFWNRLVLAMCEEYEPSYRLRKSYLHDHECPRTFAIAFDFEA